MPNSIVVNVTPAAACEYKTQIPPIPQRDQALFVKLCLYNPTSHLMYSTLSGLDF
jgi:hypothetical protein